MAAGVAIKAAALQGAKALGSKGMAGAKFLGAPVSNWTGSKMDKMKARLEPKMLQAQKLKEQWKELGLEKKKDYFGRTETMLRGTNRDKQ
jgi:hypothetical protein